MFFSPWHFLWLLFLPLLVWRMFRRQKNEAVSFTNVSFVRQLAPTLRQRLLWVPNALTLLAVVVLIAGLARPREGRELTVVDSEGIAIELVVDRSSSMRAMDFKIDNEHVDRLTAIKQVAGRFVSGGDELDGRFSDLVGLITFARFADGVTPLTLDHHFLVDRLNAADIVTERGEDGTAIGDALALAVEKLNSLDEREAKKIKSKVIILLTDGENTVGELDPIAGAELAKTMGIKIYTIGVGTTGRAPIPVQDPFTGRQRIRWIPVTIDEATLQTVAQTTNGKYFRATDTDSLTKIYAEIDRLEKTNVETKNFVNYRELAVQHGRIAGWSTPPVLLIALSLIVARVTLQNTWLRELT